VKTGRENRNRYLPLGNASSYSPRSTSQGNDESGRQRQFYEKNDPSLCETLLCQSTLMREGKWWNFGALKGEEEKKRRRRKVRGAGAF